MAAGSYTLVLVVCCMASLVLSAPGGYGGANSNIYRHDNGYDNYGFGYNIDDPYTGDHHGRQETRKGYHVAGRYQLAPYGHVPRTVKYVDNGYGVHQTVIGSEHGLYVDSPDVTIIPGHKY